MKKLFIFLFLIFSVFDLFANPALSAATTAAIANSNRRRVERERHEATYHHGKLNYWDESRYRTAHVSTKTYEFWTYRHWYYVIDPKECTIRSEKVSFGIIPMTEAEYELEYKKEKCFFIILYSLLGVLVVFLIVLAVHSILKERADKRNKRNTSMAYE